MDELLHRLEVCHHCGWEVPGSFFVDGMRVAGTLSEPVHSRTLEEEATSQSLPTAVALTQFSSPACRHCLDFEDYPPGSIPPALDLPTPPAQNVSIVTTEGPVRCMCCGRWVPLDFTCLVDGRLHACFLCMDGEPYPDATKPAGYKQFPCETRREASCS
jgi:hypothetical protein